MTIIEFLEARIAEDDAAARDDSHEMDRNSVSIQFDCDTQARFDPARVLAECEAKRAIVANVPRNTDPYAPEGHTSMHTIRALAAVYADHPDYQQEWAA